MADVKRLLGATRLLTLTGAGAPARPDLALQVAADVLKRTRMASGWWSWRRSTIPHWWRKQSPRSLASTMSAVERFRPRLRTICTRSICSWFSTTASTIIKECAVLVDGLLRACPRLKILATSREALGIGGETAWRMPSLSHPERHQISSVRKLDQYEAVRLFIERGGSGPTKLQRDEPERSGRGPGLLPA